ncbi:MAG: T9SS type A sorting domain-containing protein, partial [Bacteroidota bacterium]
QAWLNGDANADSPWFIGDEVLWFVSNDLDPARSSNLHGTAPNGVEVQTLVWGYNQSGPLGNMVFAKYTVINKGTDDLTDAYFALWSDPDLGDAADDLCGIDTVLSLGYVYNGYAVDGTYGIPPAAGYDFFQGPIVQGAPEDEAQYNFGKLPGWRNLKVSSFAYYINSDPIYADPEMGTAAGSVEMYNYLQSKLWDGSAFVDPTTGLEVAVTLAGDPVTKTGWIDGLVNAPDDRRFMMTTGPFTLNNTTDLPNGKVNKQEVVVARLIAQGVDRISSLMKLRYYDRFAQYAFDNNFQVATPPPAPIVEVSTQPNTILLSWGGPSVVSATEMHDVNGYKFQGYNVYQFPSLSSTMGDAKRVATFDLIDGVLMIFDEVLDDKTGAIVTMPVHFGTDSGIKRAIELTHDAITDRPLVNHQSYFYAVTAYAYNGDPEATPRQLESSPKIFEVSPKDHDPGYRAGADYGEHLQVLHTQGLSTGSVHVKVIDQNKLTGESYAVTFESLGTVEVDYDGGVLTLEDYGWNLTNTSLNKRLITGSSAYGGLESGYTLDGFQIGLTGQGHFVPGHEILSVDWIGGPEVYEAYTWTVGYDFFGSSILGYDVKSIVEVRFDRNTASKGYLYLRGGTPNYSYQGYFDSPMTIWDVTDKNNPKQLSYALVEQNGSSAQDTKWSPTASPGDREYLFIIDEPYSETPNPSYTGTYTILAGAGSMPILYAAWTLQTATADQSQFPWKDGDIWRWTPNVAFDASDVFTFTTPKASYSADAAKEDITSIQVFPNPYLGSNQQELNKYQRFVTFNHLPPLAKFRIFTVDGSLVRSFEKNDGSQLATWDLQNDNGLPVASGMYIIHIDMPDLGVEKVLKLGVVSEAQYLDRI